MLPRLLRFTRQTFPTIRKAAHKQRKYQNDLTLFLDGSILDVKNSNEGLLNELDYQDEIEELARQGIEDLNKVIFYGDAIASQGNLEGNSIEELPSNLLR